MLILKTLNEANMLISIVKNSTRHKEKVTKYYLSKMSGKSTQFKRRKLFDFLAEIGVIENGTNVFNKEKLYDLIVDGIRIHGMDNLIIKPIIKTPLFTIKEKL